MKNIKYEDYSESLKKNSKNVFIRNRFLKTVLIPGVLEIKVWEVTGLYNCTPWLATA